MECTCTIDGLCGEDTYDDHEEKILTHNKNYVILKCGECGREIGHGEEYEWYRGIYDGQRCTHITCLDCLSLRFYFFGDWAFETLWDCFRDSMDDCGWEVPEKCLSKVTPATRAKICEYIEREWEIQES